AVSARCTLAGNMTMSIRPKPIAPDARGTNQKSRGAEELEDAGDGHECGGAREPGRDHGDEGIAHACEVRDAGDGEHHRQTPPDGHRPRFEPWTRHMSDDADEGG